MINLTQYIKYLQAIVKKETGSSRVTCEVSKRIIKGEEKTVFWVHINTFNLDSENIYNLKTYLNVLSFGDKWQRVEFYKFYVSSTTGLTITFITDPLPIYVKGAEETLEKMTPSQHKAFERLLVHFANTFAANEFGVTYIELDPLPYGGKVFCKIRTGGNVFVSQGASFCIGSRGKLEVWTTEYSTEEDLLKLELRIK